ncbi:tetratricopeptide repeat protein [Chloroflexota bacterium]
MSFFRRSRDEAEEHHKKALRHRDLKRKECNLGQAIWHLEQAIQLKPNNPLFHYHLGRIYADAPMLAVIRDIDVSFRLRDSAELAIAELKEAIRLKPPYHEAYMVLGDVYMYLGEKEKAQLAFQAVLELVENMYLGEREKAHQAYQAVLDVVGNRWPQSYMELKSRQMEQGLSSNPQPDEARKHLEQAAMYRSQGKYKEAEKELDKAFAFAPDWHWMYDNLCIVAVWWVQRSVTHQKT